MVRLTRRRRGLSAEQAAALGIEPGERVLAWSPLAGGGLVAAGMAGIWVLTPAGRLIRRPWIEVDHAAWEAQSATLAVWWVRSRLPLALELQEPGRLPAVLHERVQASVVLSREVPVGAGRSVWLAIRKDADGALSVQANPGPGVRLTDPAVAERVEAARRALAEEAGL